MGLAPKVILWETLKAGPPKDENKVLIGFKQRLRGNRQPEMHKQRMEFARLEKDNADTYRHLMLWLLPAPPPPRLKPASPPPGRAAKGYTFNIVLLIVWP